MAARKVDQLDREAMLEVLQKAAAARKVRAEAALEEFAAELRDVFQGPRGLALSVLSEFNEAPPGSAIRASYLKLIVQVQKDEKRGGANVDESDLTDEDLADAVLPRIAAGLESDDDGEDDE
jgi:hypothetical protein